MECCQRGHEMDPNDAKHPQKLLGSTETGHVDDRGGWACSNYSRRSPSRGSPHGTVSVIPAIVTENMETTPKAAPNVMLNSVPKMRGEGERAKEGDP